MRDRTPVTVVSGTLGAGKTTLLNHLLERADRRLAVLVNDMGEVNVDAALLEGSDLARDGIAELSNGCICCELQDDLESEVRALAGRYDFDHLVVEASGISEPAPVARLFTSGAAAGRYEVDSLVTVVDAARFAELVDGEAPRASEPRAERADGPTGEGAASLERQTAPDAADRPLSDLLIEQIEVSNLVLLNKCDLVADGELARLEAVISGLQPAAEVVRTTFSDVEPDAILDRGLFDPDELGELAGWQRALAEAREHDERHEAGGDGHHHEVHDHDGTDGDGTHAHDGDDHDEGHAHRSPESVYGVVSKTFRRQRPADPGALADVLRDLPEGIVRCKGPCWLAGHDETVIQVSGAGREIDATAEGPWIASLPAAQRDLYRDNHPDLPWTDEHGDRRIELVFIGTDLAWDELEPALEACLVEPGSDPADADPFPDEIGERAVIRTDGR